MINKILIFLFFSFIIANLKPTSKVNDLKKINKIYCKDICK